MSVVTFNGTPSSSVNEAIRKIVNDLTGYQYDTNGTPSTEYFKHVWNSVTFSAAPDCTSGSLDFPIDEEIMIVLESTQNVDPFARPDLTDEGDSYDPWRICFHAYAWKKIPWKVNGTIVSDTNTPAFGMAVYVGSPTTMAYDAVNDVFNLAWKQKLGDNLLPPWTTTEFSDTYLAGKYPDLIEPLGHVGKEWTHNFDPVTVANGVKWTAAPSPLPANYLTAVSTGYTDGDGPDVLDAAQLFVNRYNNSISKPVFAATATTKTTNPVNYKTVVTDHGFFLSCWGENPEETGKGFSWMVVQRGVSKDTGITRGLPAPVSAPYGNRPLFCVFGVDDWYGKFVVREHDMDIPSSKKNAARNTEDSAAVLNPFVQQSLTENGEYVVTFINNLNSSRFKYSDELDMVGTVSADVIGGGTTIEVNVYGENENRTYEAMWPGGVDPELKRFRYVNTTDGETEFAMDFTGTYRDYSDVEVYVNGDLVNPLKYTVEYSVSNPATVGKITFLRGLPVDDVVEIICTGKKQGAFGTGMRIVVVSNIPTPNTP